MTKKEYCVTRNWLKYGNETDPVEQTIKYYDNFEKAYAYAWRYAKGVRFVSAEIEVIEYEVDENGNYIDGTIKGSLLYGIYDYGRLVEDYRTTEEVKEEETAKVEEVKEIKEEMKIQIEPIYNEPDELELENVETLNHRICLIYILNIPKDNTMLEKYGFKWSILRGCWFEVVRISQVLEYIHKKFNSFENLDLESYYKLLELLKADGVERIGVEWQNHWLTIVLKEDIYKCYEETYRGHLGHKILEKHRNPIEYFTDKKEKKQ